MKKFYVTMETTMFFVLSLVYHHSSLLNSSIKQVICVGAMAPRASSHTLTTSTPSPKLLSRLSSSVLLRTRGDPCVRNILRVVLIEYDTCPCICSFPLIPCPTSDSSYILTTTFFPSAIHRATFPP